MQTTFERDANLIESMPFDADPEAIEAFSELERRRALAAAGRSRVLDEGEALDALRAAGCHV